MGKSSIWIQWKASRHRKNLHYLRALNRSQTSKPGLRWNRLSLFPQVSRSSESHAMGPEKRWKRSNQWPMKKLPRSSADWRSRGMPKGKSCSRDAATMLISDHLACQWWIPQAQWDSRDFLQVWWGPVSRHWTSLLRSLDYLRRSL